MNYFKSSLVLFILLGMLLGSGLLCRRIFFVKNNKSSTVSKFVCVVCIVITIASIFVMGDYTYPFERDLDPVLFAQFDVPEEYALDYPGQKFWRGAYEAFGGYPESFYFDPDQRTSMYGFEWPLMDFEHFSYIITYGQEIDTLSYNVWDILDTPEGTGAKVGHMKLKDKFSPRTVYIYRIPKLRIENDRNDLSGLWD